LQPAHPSHCGYSRYASDVPPTFLALYVTSEPSLLSGGGASGNRSIDDRILQRRANRPSHLHRSQPDPGQLLKHVCRHFYETRALCADLVNFWSCRGPTRSCDYRPVPPVPRGALSNTFTASEHCPASHLQSLDCHHYPATRSAAARKAGRKNKERAAFGATRP
jgi:hypothetical protein